MNQVRVYLLNLVQVFIVILNRCLPGTPASKVLEVKKVRRLRLICGSIRGFSFIQKAAHLHSPQQLAKNPAAVPGKRLLSLCSLPALPFLHVHLSSVNPRLSCQQEWADQGWECIYTAQTPRALWVCYPHSQQHCLCARVCLCGSPVIWTPTCVGMSCTWVVHCHTTRYNLLQISL